MRWCLVFYLLTGFVNITSWASPDVEDDLIASQRWREEHSPKIVRILAIDGGGMRGLIPARLLQEVEAQTGKSILDHFDFFAGTSTGSLISLGLTIPKERSIQPRYSAADIVDIYHTYGKEIFARPLSESVLNPYSVRGPKYSPDNLKKILGTYFGETPLSSALKPVLVTSYDMKTATRITFTSHDAAVCDEYDFPMRKVARASSAAPAFFPPSHMKMKNRETRILTDGCIWALNPAEAAYRSARKLFPDSEIQVVSLGTGARDTTLSHKVAKGMGALGWAAQLSFHTIMAQMDLVDQHLKESLPGRSGVPGYLRLNVGLDPGQGEMDDTSDRNLAYLEAKALEITESKDFGILLKMLEVS